MSVVDKAIDLGKAITETDEYKNMQTAQAAMTQDGEATKLVQDFQNLKKSYERMQSMGHTIEEKHLENLKRLHDQMMSSPVVKQYEEARTKFDQLITQVNSKINEGMGKPSGEDSCGTGG